MDDIVLKHLNGFLVPVTLTNGKIVDAEIRYLGGDTIGIKIDDMEIQLDEDQVNGLLDAIALAQTQGALWS